MEMPQSGSAGDGQSVSGLADDAWIGVAGNGGNESAADSSCVSGAALRGNIDRDGH